MEENKKMSKSTKIILGILIAIVCICVAFFAMSNVKKSKAKKEYKNLLEKEMDNISQDYNLSKVTVQVTGIKKWVIDYSLDAIIDCECDNNNALIFDDGNNEEYDYDQVIYDYDQLVLFEKAIEYAVYHASNGLTTIKSDGDDNWLLHTTVTLNGKAVRQPPIERASSSSSKNSSRCKYCGRSFTDDENKKSIRHTNMCLNCYDNYQFGVAAQSAAEQYRQNN